MLTDTIISSHHCSPPACWAALPDLGADGSNSDSDCGHAGPGDSTEPDGYSMPEDASNFGVQASTLD
jgi:hypothetical protein